MRRSDWSKPRRSRGRGSFWYLKMTATRTPTPQRRTRALDHHADLIERLAEVRGRHAQQARDCEEFLRDASAPEKVAVLKAIRDLRALTPEVTVLCAQTGAVVERIANANDVAAKMTKEVRRIDVLQSRLTATLGQSSQLVSLRNALAGIRRAMQLQNYPSAAEFLKQLKEIEKIMPLDVADKLRVDTIESDLKGIIETAFDEGLRTDDRARVQMYGPLFQIVGEAYEAHGFAMLLAHVTGELEEQLAPMLKGSFSTKELMDHLTIVFNKVAAIAQEYDQIAITCFPRASGLTRLIQAIYAIGEKASSSTLSSYIAQRKFHDRMTESDSNSSATNPASAAKATEPGTEDAIAALNEQLNEVALIIQHTQTYERFMRSRIDHENQSTEESSQTPVLPSSSESELGKSVQELAAYYCFFENELLNKAAKKAFQWEELRYSSASTTTERKGALSAGTHGSEIVTFPISSAIDEIFYVARNSGLRGLATGHADCAAGVLNMINTILRDALGDTMRFRIRNMATHMPRYDQEGGLVAASNQLRGQMQQQLAKFSKIQISAPASGVIGSVGSANSGYEVRKEFGPDVVMNSLEATGAYIAQLKSEFENELRDDFDEVPSHLQTCLAGLNDAAGELSQLLQAARKKLCKVLEAKLTASLAPLLSTSSKKTVTYELTDEMFTINEANDPFAHQFVVTVREIVNAFRSTLSPTNLTSFVEALATTTAELLERWFSGHYVRFSALGALQFDKDLRVISGFFNEAGGECRSQFAALTQIVMVLSVDAPADVQDFFGRRSRGGMEWRLTAAQVKEILSRRVEFSDSAINKLSL